MIYGWNQKVIATVLSVFSHKGAWTILLNGDVLPNLKVKHAKRLASFLSNCLNRNRNGVMRVNDCMIAMHIDSHSVHHVFGIQKSSSNSGCL